MKLLPFPSICAVRVVHTALQALGGAWPGVLCTQCRAVDDRQFFWSPRVAALSQPYQVRADRAQLRHAGTQACAQTGRLPAPSRGIKAQTALPL